MARDPRFSDRHARADDVRTSGTHGGRARVYLPRGGWAGLVGVAFVVMASYGDGERAQDTPQIEMAAGEDGVQTTSLAVAPDGTMIATTDTIGRVALWDRENGWTIETFLDVTGFASGVAFSPKGRLLAVQDVVAGLSLWNLATEGPPQQLPVTFLGTTAMAFSPDGRKLAAAKRSTAEILIWDLEERRVWTILRGRSPFASLTFSADGRYLAVGEDGVKTAVLVWDLATRREHLVLEGSSGSIVSIAFSPGGGLLASVSAYERGARLWDVARPVAPDHGRALLRNQRGRVLSRSTHPRQRWKRRKGRDSGARARVPSRPYWMAARHG